jgi:spore coat polysaccharide biosynthesis protein SpsF (cytidylyltransferase family)
MQTLPRNKMTFTYEQLKDAVVNCTSYDLHVVIDDDKEQAYALIDPFGDIDGDLFYDLDDVADYITNNQQVDEYLFSNYEY